MARRGRAWQGEAGILETAARYGRVMRGVVWSGEAGRGFQMLKAGYG